MKGFRNTTKTLSGHSFPATHGFTRSTGGTINRLAVGGPVAARDKIDSNPGHPEVYPPEGDRTRGNSATQRKVSSTRELEEHGGKTPLTAGFKSGGKAKKHFHVHKHFHSGGKTRSVTHSYAASEKHAERYAEGGHIHDSTSIPPGPDYAKGGTMKPGGGGRFAKLKAKLGRRSGVTNPGALAASIGRKKYGAKKMARFSANARQKNAGGALYATGGTINRLAAGGLPMGPGMPVGTLGRLAMQPRVPLRRPMPMPGGPRPPFVTRAEGGSIGAGQAREIAHSEVKKHVGYPAPTGHKGLASMVRRR